MIQIQWLFVIKLDEFELTVNAYRNVYPWRHSVTTEVLSININSWNKLHRVCFGMSFIIALQIYSSSNLDDWIHLIACPITYWLMYLAITYCLDAETINACLDASNNFNCSNHQIVCMFCLCSYPPFMQCIPTNLTYLINLFVNTVIHYT